MGLLIEEINASAPTGELPLRTLYFGGGTPSLIPPQQLDRLIRAIDKRFGIAAGAEISMEADPGTFDAEGLRQYMSSGLSRFSIGVQAFQEVSIIYCPWTLSMLLAGNPEHIGHLRLIACFECETNAVVRT